MPRPGSRPYECVRRAWHSDRHQPIRGSLIQEIFRVVNEIHSSATKKNKEWQEKLPVVVLRAEEIMYSKANSEAEYMDLKTLLDRANDAINTIIRLDESTETGELIQPCIEAALNLGCSPRRASRSQRNSNRGCYLNPTSQEPKTFSPGAVHNAIQPTQITNSHCGPNYSNIIKSKSLNLIHPSPEPQNLVYQNKNVNPNRLLFPADNGPIFNAKPCFLMENCAVSGLCSDYPLYYGSCLEPQAGFGIDPKSIPDTIKPVKAGIMRNLFSCREEAPVHIDQRDHKDIPCNVHEIGCDLSLRLGSLPGPSPSYKKGHLQDVEDTDYGCSQQQIKLHHPLPQTDKESVLFSRVSVDDPLNPHSRRLTEHLNADANVRKRKAIFGHTAEDQQFCW